MSDWSSPGFFNKGDTRPCFSDEGNIPVLKEMFTSLVMSGAITLRVDFSMVVGMKSTGDDLAGSEHISFETSFTTLIYIFLLGNLLVIVLTCKLCT